MSLIIYTCLFGYTDPLHEPACTTDARLVCYTDNHGLTSQHWEIIQVPKTPYPCRQARLAKAMSHTLIDAEWSLWLDANFTLEVDPYVLLGEAAFTTFVHPDRSRIRDEAREIIRLGKAPADLIQAQLAAYQAEGFDTDANPQQVLSCNSVILRRHTPEVIALNELWAEEINTRSLRDQMSLDYCAWKLGLAINRWPGSHRQNQFFRHKYYKRPVNDV